MLSLFTRVLLVSALAAGTGAAQERIDVVATIPDLGSLVEEIGGDAVDVEVLVKPGQDPHYVLAKASLLLKVSRADALVVMGLNYEHAFLPAVLEKCRNKDVLPGGRGYLNVGERISVLDAPESLDRGQGADLHPFGNPHYNVDPENGRIMARAITDLLVRLLPDRKDAFESRWKAWDEQAQRRIEEWQERLAPFQGRKLVTYHKSWPYFAQRFGLEILGEIEPKPGLPPTPRHLTALAGRMKESGVELILIEPWYNERSVAGLLEATGATLVSAPVTCGVLEGTDRYLDFIDRLVSAVATGLGG